jgi:hypothetical protein
MIMKFEFLTQRGNHVVHGLLLDQLSFWFAGRWSIHSRGNCACLGLGSLVPIQNVEFISVAVALNSGFNTSCTLGAHLITLRRLVILLLQKFVARAYFLLHLSASSTSSRRPSINHGRWYEYPSFVRWSRNLPRYLRMEVCDADCTLDELEITTMRSQQSPTPTYTPRMNIYINHMITFLGYF